MKLKHVVVLEGLLLGGFLLLSAIQPSLTQERGTEQVTSINPNRPRGSVDLTQARENSITPRQPTQSQSWRLPPTGVPVEGCSNQPLKNPPKPHIETSFVAGQLTRDRFRKALDPQSAKTVQWPPGVPAAVRNYTPREWYYLAHPTNFGERYLRDILGQPAFVNPIIVLHETVSPGLNVVRTFLTPHARDDDQASYHALILRNGTVIYLVPPDKRAFGAGNSIFVGRNGAESVRTSQSLSPSVNNFAYHISLETPPDGMHNGPNHSGYTNAQYYGLAWLVAKTGIPNDRITTHKAVDRSGSRQDPRSFNWSAFQNILSQYPKTQEILVGCASASEKNVLSTEN